MLPYEEKKQRLIQEIRSSGGDIRLGKDTSNLFRDRTGKPTHRLNVRDFNQVIAVNSDEGWLEVEGMTPYAALVDATLKHGVMPTVVPQLKSITIGGAVSGGGIESSSFRYGLVHETVQEMEVLLANGQVVFCTPENEHRDLFFGFPNSYGTLGYILKLKTTVVPVKKYVHLTHTKYTQTASFFQQLDEECAKRDNDFVDGTIFSPEEMVVTVGRFTDEAPFVSDYTFMEIYYRSLQRKQEDFLKTANYLWRWDTDWFWCSKNFGVQNPILRRIAGKERLNSIFYTKLMRWNAKWQAMQRIQKLLGIHAEAVIQDVCVPVERAVEFFDFYFREINIRPVWICPTRNFDETRSFSLFPTKPNVLYLDFGFWDSITGREKHEAGFYNRKIERKVQELQGVKSLYSDSYFPKEEFWSIYNRPAYDRLKAKYDPEHKLKDLYEKCVMKK